MTLTCSVEEDGSIAFTDRDGNEVPSHVIERAKRQNRDVLLDLITRKCDEINEGIEDLALIHLDTPTSKKAPRFTPAELPRFEALAPGPEPVMRRLGLLDKLLRSRRVLAEARHELDLQVHRDKLATYEAERKAFEQHRAAVEEANATRKALIETGIYSDTEAMAEWLQLSLQAIEWPRETEVAFEILEDGRLVVLDVDLPEIEHMPTRTASVPARGLKLSVKDIPASKIAKMYLEHVHGIAFRVIGETFAALPRSRQVVFSGYSQRPDPATAQTRSDYVLSVRVQRSEWERIDFRSLAAIDVVVALDEFDLRRKVSTKRGARLDSIEPHVAHCETDGWRRG